LINTGISVDQRINTGRWHPLLIVATSLGLTAPLLFLLATGHVLTRDDLGVLHLPFRYLYQEALKQGELLLWTPAYHSGFFLYGAGEAGMLHPLHLALYRMLPLAAAFNLEILASYVSLFTGTALLGQRLGISLTGALFGAMSFAFSGFTLFNLMHVNHIGTFAHAPWMLLAMLELATATTARRHALAFGSLALVTGLQVLAGNPQYVWLTSVALLYMIACNIVTRKRRRSLPLITIALAAGLAAGAVQLLPTLEFLTNSPRATWSAEAAMTFSLSPLNLIQLWSPFAFEFRVAAVPAEQFIVHEFIVYNGAFCTAAFLWLLIRYRAIQHRGLFIACAAFAGINLVLAFGRYGGIYPWLAMLPGIGSFRAPARHLVLVQWGMSGIAAIAFDDLRRTALHGIRLSWRELWPMVALCVSAVATALAAAVLADSAWAASQELRFSGLTRSMPWTLIVIAITTLIILSARGYRWAIPVLICASALDLGLWGYSYLFRWTTIETPAAIANLAPAPRDARAGDLIPTVDGGPNEYGILRGLRLTDGYTGLTASAVLDPRDPITQRLAGVNWQYRSGTWTRVEDAYPRARLSSKSATDSAHIVHERPGRFVIATIASETQLLLMTEKFHQGWNAFVDGNAITTQRAFSDFLACKVPAGSHQIELIFMPRSFVAGASITGAAVLIILVVTTWLWRRPDAGLRVR